MTLHLLGGSTSLCLPQNLIIAKNDFGTLTKHLYSALLELNIAMPIHLHLTRHALGGGIRPETRRLTSSFNTNTDVNILLSKLAALPDTKIVFYNINAIQKHDIPVDAIVSYDELESLDRLKNIRPDIFLVVLVHEPLPQNTAYLFESTQCNFILYSSPEEYILISPSQEKFIMEKNNAGLKEVGDLVANRFWNSKNNRFSYEIEKTLTFTNNEIFKEIEALKTSLPLDSFVFSANLNTDPHSKLKFLVCPYLNTIIVSELVFDTDSFILQNSKDLEKVSHFGVLFKNSPQFDRVIQFKGTLNSEYKDSFRKRDSVLYERGTKKYAANLCVGLYKVDNLGFSCLKDGQMFLLYKKTPDIKQVLSEFFQRYIHKE